MSARVFAAAVRRAAARAPRRPLACPHCGGVVLHYGGAQRWPDGEPALALYTCLAAGRPCYGSTFGVER